MKYRDRVRVLTDDYVEFGIHKGDEGHILAAEIRYGTFLFFRENVPSRQSPDGSQSEYLPPEEYVSSS